MVRKLFLALSKSDRLNLMFDAREPFDRKFLDHNRTFDMLVAYSLYRKQKIFQESRYKLIQLFEGDFQVLGESRKKDNRTINIYQQAWEFYALPIVIKPFNFNFKTAKK